MFLQFILEFILTWISWLFLPLPDIPSFSSDLQGFLDYAININQSVAWVGSFIYTPTLWTVVVSLALVVVTFDYIYALIGWVLRKIPGALRPSL